MSPKMMIFQGVKHMIYYYTPLPLNLAYQQASNKQATSNASPFRFGHYSVPTLWALLYSSHPRA